jgi:hypothetical protein
VISLLLLAATVGTVISAVHLWQHPPANARRGPHYPVGVALAATSLAGAVVLGRTAAEGMSGM